MFLEIVYEVIFGIVFCEVSWNDFVIYEFYCGVVKSL